MEQVRAAPVAPPAVRRTQYIMPFNHVIDAAIAASKHRPDDEDAASCWQYTHYFVLHIKSYSNGSPVSFLKL